MPTVRSSALRSILMPALFMLAMVGLASCGTKPPTPSSPPRLLDFAQALQYAQRASLAYEQDTTIRQQSGTGVRVSISTPLSSGIKAYVEQDDAKHVQWIVVRGTSNLINIQLDVDYNKVVDSRLQIPLHKGFADSALQVYQFAKPLLKSDYETASPDIVWAAPPRSSSSCC